MITSARPTEIVINKTGWNNKEFKNQVAPKPWTKYDITEFNEGSMTLKQFFAHMKE